MTNVSRISSRNWEIIIHVAVWIFVFSSTLMILFQGREGDSPFLWRNLNLNVATLLVFYVNYLYLIPRFIERANLKVFVLINVALLLAAGIAIYEVNEYVRQFETLRQHGGMGRRAGMPYWLLVVRDGLGLIFAIGAAVAIRFSLQRQRAINAQKEAELGRSRAELMNLRSQINPHFLLNTLNNIYALIAFDTDKAQKAVIDLGDMLRYILYDNGQDYTQLRKEVDFLNNYIALMRMRLAKNVEVSVDFDDVSKSDLVIAPLIFISLVENAFKHGVSTTQKSFIRISMHISAGMLTFVTENSYHPKSIADHSGSGIGLKQVEQRLAYSYPGRHTWQHGVDTAGEVYSSIITIQL